MIRLDARRLALAAIVAGAVYMATALATGRSARSEPPLDLMPGATESGLDVWKAAALILEGGVLVADVRPAGEYARYHIPRAQNVPGAEATRLGERAQGRAVLVVAGRDEEGRRLVAALRAADANARAYYLSGGPRAWYLALELPVPLFNEGTVPAGYDAALGAVREALLAPSLPESNHAGPALETLARLNYQPALLKPSGRGAPGAGRSRKITGGCG